VVVVVARVPGLDKVLFITLVMVVVLITLATVKAPVITVVVACLVIFRKLAHRGQFVLFGPVVQENSQQHERQMNNEPIH